MSCSPLCLFALVYSERNHRYIQKGTHHVPPSEQQESLRFTITTYRIPKGPPVNLQTPLQAALSADFCQSCAQHLVFWSLPPSLPFSDTQLRLCQGWLRWLRHHFNCYVEFFSSYWFKCLRTLSPSMAPLRLCAMAPKLQSTFPALYIFGILTLLCPSALCGEYSSYGERRVFSLRYGGQFFFF